MCVKTLFFSRIWNFFFVTPVFFHRFLTVTEKEDRFVLLSYEVHLQLDIGFSGNIDDFFTLRQCFFIILCFLRKNEKKKNFFFVVFKVFKKKKKEYLQHTI